MIRRQSMVSWKKQMNKRRSKVNIYVLDYNIDKQK